MDSAYFYLGTLDKVDVLITMRQSEISAKEKRLAAQSVAEFIHILGDEDIEHVSLIIDMFVDQKTYTAIADSFEIVSPGCRGVSITSDNIRSALTRLVRREHDKLRYITPARRAAELIGADMDLMINAISKYTSGKNLILRSFICIDVIE